MGSRIAYESGSTEDEYGYGRGCGYHGGMDDVHESSTNASLWIGPDDTKIENFSLPFDPESCLLTDEAIEDLFDEDPDKEE